MVKLFLLSKKIFNVTYKQDKKLLDEFSKCCNPSKKKIYELSKKLKIPKIKIKKWFELQNRINEVDKKKDILKIKKLCNPIISKKLLKDFKDSNF